MNQHRDYGYKHGELYVEPPVVKAVGQDVAAFSVAVGDAHTYASTNLPEFTGSTEFFRSITERLGRVRYKLGSDYSLAGAHLDNAAAAIDAMGVAYLRTDDEQDRLIDESISLFGVMTEGAQERWADSIARGSGDDSRRIGREEAGYSVESAPAWSTLRVSPPSAYDGSVVSHWSDVRDTIDEIFDFFIPGDAVQLLGGPSALGRFNQFERDFKADWQQVGYAVNALKALADFWQELGAEALGTHGRMDGRWEGHAAGHVIQYLLGLAKASADHMHQVRLLAERIESIGAMVYAFVDPLLDTVIDLWDVVDQVIKLGFGFGPGLLDSLKGGIDDLFGGLMDGGKEVLGLLEKGGKLLGRVIMLIDLVVSAVEALKLIWWHGTDWESMPFALDHFWEHASIPDLGGPR